MMMNTGLCRLGKGGKKKFDDFLSAPAIIDPMEVGPTTTDKVRREVTEYEAEHQRFRTLKREYAQQYAPLYFHRLQTMRARLLKAAKARWGATTGSKSPASKSSSSSSSSSMAGPRVVGKILELRPGEEVIVAGTLYKEMPLRPNILETYAKEVCACLATSFLILIWMNSLISTSAPSFHRHFVQITRAIRTP